MSQPLVPRALLFLKALAQGERWITVHPNGPDEKGQPVLIQPAGDGSYHVVGGAGGKLNYLKLTGVKSEDSYKAEAKQRAQSRREEQKRRQASDKAHGLTASKARVTEALKAQLGDQRVKLVQEVAKALGWKDEDLRFPAEKFADLSDAAKAKAEKEHAGTVMKAVKEAVDFQRRRMVMDAETRLEAGLGEVPLTSERPDQLSVQDLAPVPETPTGLGYNRPKADVSKAEVAEEAAAARGPETPRKAEQRQERKDLGQQIAAELEAIREPPPRLDPAKMIEARKAIAVLKAAKEFAMVAKEVQKKTKQVAQADEVVEPKAYPLEVGKAPVDQDVVKDLEGDLRTLRTRAFLDQIGPMAGGEASLGRYIGVGAFNAVNSLALAAGGTAMLDRAVVDVLGIAGAAQLLARRLRKDLTDAEMTQTAEAMAAFHVDHYMETSAEALRQAKEWHEMAHEIEIGEARNGADLMVAQELNAKRREFTRNAQQVLGTALGEMEANAALTLALKQPAKDSVQVSLGKTSIESAILQARGLGLERGDYDVEKAGASTFLTVRESGLDRLVQPVSRADLESLRESQAIINGERDDPNWLPGGVATRPDLMMSPKEGVAPRLAKPFAFAAAGGQSPQTVTRDSLEVGARTGGADGEVDAKRLASAFHNAVTAAVARGDRVELHSGDGRVQPLSARDGRAVMPDGAGVGVIGALSDKRAKLVITPNPAAAMSRAVGDYIGGRAADGEAPADILSGLLSEEIMSKVADRAAFLDAVNQIAPLYDKAGKMIRAEAHTEAFNKLADDFVERTYGADRTPLQRQTLTVDETAMDALHRALLATPEGVAAFKPIGELTPQDETALRKVFAKEYGRTDPKAEALRQKVEDLDKQEPEKESEGLFGRGPNPDHARWQQERDGAAEAYNAAAMTWGKYVKTMGSPQAAYAAIADTVKGTVLERFAHEHNKLRPKAPLKIGRQVIQHDLKHLDALDPQARDKRVAEQNRLVASLRNRVAGKFAAGGVGDKIEAARQAEAAAAQAQMGLFGSTEEEGADKPLGLGERFSLGQAAERQIAGMMSVVGPNFRPGQSFKPMRPSMAGEYIARQRAVKLIGHNKRQMLAMGVGSGKTSIMLTGFTDLATQGKVKKGLFAVPSVVQGDFHGTALRMLEPGKFRWHADPGADRAARLAAYKDPENHFTVVTHQALREDFDHLAEADGMTTEKFDALAPDERKAYAQKLMAREGWNLGYLAVDEGHNLLNRAGKANSHLANVVDAISSNTEYYVNATADPVKNDASEAYDVLHKLEPGRYADRDAFMRKYGVDTPASRDALQREMARHFYTANIKSGKQANKTTVNVPIDRASGQHDGLEKLDAAASAARLARMAGKVDVGAMQTLAPFAFEGVDPAQHEAVARKLQSGLGMIYQTAVDHAVSDGAKTEALAKIANERKGKPGVVFARRLDRVDQIAKRLSGEGHRVATLTGAHSAAQKDQIKRDYQAGKYDVLVASDAGAVGANLQAGKWLVQYDQPLTAMLHAQRNGRIDRVGQTDDVELIDLLADHVSERRARDRLAKKYELRSVMTSPLEGLDDHGIAGYLARAKAGTLEENRPVFDVGPHDQAPSPKPGDQMQLAA